MLAKRTRIFAISVGALFLAAVVYMGQVASCSAEETVSYPRSSWELISKTEAANFAAHTIKAAHDGDLAQTRPDLAKYIVENIPTEDIYLGDPFPTFNVSSTEPHYYLRGANYPIFHNDTFVGRVWIATQLEPKYIDISSTKVNSIFNSALTDNDYMIKVYDTSLFPRDEENYLGGPTNIMMIGDTTWTSTDGKNEKRGQRYDGTVSRLADQLTKLVEGSNPRAHFMPITPGTWIEDGTGWWFSKMQDEYPIGWAYLNGDWYYFNDLGYMLNGWMLENGSWYYLNSVHDGSFGALKSGWIQDSGRWYYLHPESDGACGRMLTGWQYVNGSWYYLHSDGHMAQNESIDGYYLSNSGAMQ